MTIVYCVQSASDLVGSAGYSHGLLEADHPKILVSFIDYATNQQTLHRQTPIVPKPRVVRRKPTMKARKP